MVSNWELLYYFCHFFHGRNFILDELILFSDKKFGGGKEITFLELLLVGRNIYDICNRGAAAVKEELRKEILLKRRNMAKEERQRGSLEIIDTLCFGTRYKRANTIFTFVGMTEEINTYPLIERAWKDGKQVAVPIAKAKGEMFFVLLSSFGELAKSRFGVMEPQKGGEWEVHPQKEDLFLVPGSVFDKKGNRYGYGGGYYDRYFERYPALYKIALAFSFQVMEFELEVEKFDVVMDCIVTENGVIGGFAYEQFN